MESTKLERTLRRIATIISVVIISFSLLGALSGVLLSFYYQPTAGGAYHSLEVINNSVSNGWLIRKIHEIAGNGVIVAALIQIVVMFLGRQFRQSWLTAWVSGIFFTLSAIGLSWTAMVLGWTQEGYWRFNIELGTIESIPVVGQLLRVILTGGGAISTLTVEHLYTLHSYLLSIAALTLAIVHLVSLLQQEKEMKQEVLEASQGVSVVES
jgi:quinol-cytochrome oxidoreductase complex cytochrome b subunit